MMGSVLHGDSSFKLYGLSPSKESGVAVAMVVTTDNFD